MIFTGSSNGLWWRHRNKTPVINFIGRTPLLGLFVAGIIGSIVAKKGVGGEFVVVFMGGLLEGLVVEIIEGVIEMNITLLSLITAILAGFGGVIGGALARKK